MKSEVRNFGVTKLFIYLFKINDRRTRGLLILPDEQKIHIIIYTIRNGFASRAMSGHPVPVSSEPATTPASGAVTSNLSYAHCTVTSQTASWTCQSSLAAGSQITTVLLAQANGAPCGPSCQPSYGAVIEIIEFLRIRALDDI